MYYNNQFPYMNNYYKPAPAAPVNNQPYQLIGAWVQGKEGAKGYMMPPNAVAVLLDSENEGMMYIKNVDGFGIPNLRQFKYVEAADEPTAAMPNLSEYVRKDELQNLIAEIAGGGKNESTV